MGNKYAQAIKRLEGAIVEAIENAPRWQNGEVGIVAYVNRDGEIDFDVCPAVSTREVAYHLDGWVFDLTIHALDWEEATEEGIHEAASDMAEEEWDKEISKGMLGPYGLGIEDEEEGEEEGGEYEYAPWEDERYAKYGGIPAWDDEV